MFTFQLPYILSVRDLFLTPIYFCLLVALVLFWKKKYYKDSPVQQYILPVFILKMICCVLLALLYNFHYGFGDIHNYFSGSREIWNAACANPKYALELIFKPLADCSPKAQTYASHLAFNYWDASTTLMFKISGFTEPFCFGAYMPAAMIFTLFAFMGSWKIFMVFYTEFPQYKKYIALGCLFAPSALIWGTNMLKDPLCLFGLGICTAAMYDIIKGRFQVRSILLLSLGIIILLALKNYILFAFVVAAAITLYRNFILKIKSNSIKNIMRFTMFACLMGAFAWCYSNMEEIGGFVYENFTQKTEVIQNVQTKANSEGESLGYTIPSSTDFSIIGITTTYLYSLNVSLFRPYIWEASNLMTLINAIETLFILVLVLFLLIKTRLKGFFSFTFQNPLLLFALIFTLILAPLVGFVSFNFGTLSRYKLPVIPFFYTYLFILYAVTKKNTATHLSSVD